MANWGDFRLAERQQQYGMGNIDLTQRPIIYKDASGKPLPNNGYSTVYSQTFWPDETGENKYVLVPGVREGLDKQMTPDEALSWYKQTGQYLGKFNSNAEADAYANTLHEEQAKAYKPQSVKNLYVNALKAK
jgi:hypothetical protein